RLRPGLTGSARRQFRRAGPARRPRAAVRARRLPVGGSSARFVRGAWGGGPDRTLSRRPRSNAGEVHLEGAAAAVAREAARLATVAARDLPDEREAEPRARLLAAPRGRAVEGGED